MMSRKVRPFTPFEGSLTRDEVFRAAIPPWKNLTHPLVQYEIRKAERRGTQPWLAVTIAVLTGIGLVATVAVRPGEWEALWVGMLTGMVVYLMVGRLRLFITIAQRAAAMITVRRERGDWDLIMLTPIPKAQWLKMQMTALVWQTWPLVRGLMVAQAIFVLLAVGYLGVQQHEKHQNEYLTDSYDYYPQPDAKYLPAEIFVIMALPIGAMTILLPVIEAGMYAASALQASADSKNAAFSIFRAIFYLGTGRLVATAGFIFVTPLVIAALGLPILTLFPAETDSIDLRIAFIMIAAGAIFGTLFSYGLSIPILALVWEWLPWVGIVALQIEAPYGFHAVIFLGFLLSLPFTYGYMPIEGMRGFLVAGLNRISKRE